MKSKLVVMIASLALVACGATSSGSDTGPVLTDAGNTVDAYSAPDVGASATLNGCAETDFVDRTTGTTDSRMIMVPTGTFSFDFPCMTIRAGQSVMFMWNFSIHPLADGGIAPGQTGTGTTPSPIVGQTAGTLYTVAFPTEGDYPFYCNVHYASGMVGVVHVVP